MHESRRNLATIMISVKERKCKTALSKYITYHVWITLNESWSTSHETTNVKWSISSTQDWIFNLKKIMDEFAFRLFTLNKFFTVSILSLCINLLSSQRLYNSMLDNHFIGMNSYVPRWESAQSNLLGCIINNLRSKLIQRNAKCKYFGHFFQESKKTIFISTSVLFVRRKQQNMWINTFYFVERCVLTPKQTHDSLVCIAI